MAKKTGESLVYLDLMRVVTVFALILLFLAQSGSGAVFDTYEGFTRWAVPGFLMLCGAFAMERGDSLRGALLNLVLPTFIVLIEPAFPSIRAYIDDSFLGPFFYNSNFLLSFVRGVV